MAMTLNSQEIRSLAQRGELYRQQGQYTQAIDNFNQVIEHDPHHAWAFAHRGVTYRQIKNYQLALADFNQALCLKPDYAWILIHRAYLYSMKKQYDIALLDFDKAMSINDNILPYPLGERSLLLSYLGRYAEAIDCCLQGLQENSGDYISAYNLAVVKAYWQGSAPLEINQARALLQTLMDTAPDRAGILYRLGGLAALENQLEQALNYLQPALILAEEPRELVHHDLAWWRWRADPRFQAIIMQEYER